ncbi:uracil-DNA glycosylase family protein [Pseudidiomarina terrestris]|uniref:uracil-DNA glycosylase family protein n=1 Tax=Pseudidiomarina terrestris TaxID=2820060 RepID=UPI00265692EA|nr:MULTISPECIES: uracil-DNA glycosylase family protein [unclassified Pseudidiomarina]MDN7135598.1 uracil-DNA glycosylase family protein [Pseudidiomarina sp. 1ASP75-5]MDN7137364.1 uracil-DNA glycosylase family protein [Pseudidiomarina sp. 1ASP75-14]MEA3589108.1 uracil-DNA glycosylase family protein [Pseudidiomarina sp. 1APP75-27a]
MALDLLLKQIRSCHECEPDLPCGARPVVQASTTAPILIAGQAPGRRVHASGLPFDDPSGDRLRSWLGVDRETFYDAQYFAIAPMGFCYPGTGKSGDLPPRKECAPLWRQPLLNELPNLRLTLAIGKYAIDWHLAQLESVPRYKNLTETVANWEEYWPAVLPMPHPSPRNNIWLKRHPWFEQEVVPQLQRRVRALLKLKSPVPGPLERDN